MPNQIYVIFAVNGLEKLPLLQLTVSILNKKSPFRSKWTFVMNSG